MNVDTPVAWNATDYCFRVTNNVDDSLVLLAAEIYARVCRVDHAMPGFCLIDVGPEVDSQSLRSAMVVLGNALDKIHREQFQRELTYVSAARFDQQETTKLHRDGGPDQSLLLLGYELTSIAAELSMCDYSRCADSTNLTPAEFLQRHNPMFAGGAEMLAPFTTRVACFNHRSNQILVVNNSVANLGNDQWQGVLHTATIAGPDADQRRVVNSVMLASVPGGTPSVLSKDDIKDFVETMVVRRRGYDKLDLEDDL